MGGWHWLSLLLALCFSLPKMWYQCVTQFGLELLDPSDLATSISQVCATCGGMKRKERIQYTVRGNSEETNSKISQLPTQDEPCCRLNSLPLALWICRFSVFRFNQPLTEKIPQSKGISTKTIQAVFPHHYSPDQHSIVTISIESHEQSRDGTKCVGGQAQVSSKHCTVL